mmetsp:Transcript_121422/g.288514  ORF Transcript_121422/g.288514 Transcript_121422/m.288514 type:complete len:201 (+) Transcript_121422:176-778(+)
MESTRCAADEHLERSGADLGAHGPGGGLQQPRSVPCLFQRRRADQTLLHAVPKPRSFLASGMGLCVDDASGTPLPGAGGVIAGAAGAVEGAAPAGLLHVHEEPHHDLLRRWLPAGVQVRLGAERNLRPCLGPLCAADLLRSSLRGGALPRTAYPEHRLEGLSERPGHAAAGQDLCARRHPLGGAVHCAGGLEPHLRVRHG